MTACAHCATEPVARRIHVKTVGSVPVTLTLCDCDQLRCPHPKCRGVIGRIAVGVHRCPHCDGRL